jgi:hypothetical protein
LTDGSIRRITLRWILEKYVVRVEADETDSGSCLMVGFGVSDVEATGSTTKVFVFYNYTVLAGEMNFLFLDFMAFQCITFFSLSLV